MTHAHNNSIENAERAAFKCARIVDWWAAWIEAEIEAKSRAAQQQSSAGQPQAPEKIAGFAWRDLELLCDNFARGDKWTEDALIDKPLPGTGEMLSRLRYKELINVFVAQGIISDRGGPGNKTGKLIITDPAEMKKRLKYISPTLPRGGSTAP